MLIRNQNKTLLLNYSGLSTIDTMKIDEDYVVTCLNFEDTYTLGRYSQKEKVIKVLDMIQEAYAKYETIHTSATGLATMSLFIESTNEVNELYMKIQNVLEKAVVFQMPEDLEVEA